MASVCTLYENYSSTSIKIISKHEHCILVTQVFWRQKTINPTSRIHNLFADTRVHTITILQLPYVTQHLHAQLSKMTFSSLYLYIYIMYRFCTFWLTNNPSAYHNTTSREESDETPRPASSVHTFLIPLHGPEQLRRVFTARSDQNCFSRRCFSYFVEDVLDFNTRDLERLPMCLSRPFRAMCDSLCYSFSLSFGKSDVATLLNQVSKLVGLYSVGYMLLSYKCVNSLITLRY